MVTMHWWQLVLGILGVVLGMLRLSPRRAFELCKQVKLETSSPEDGLWDRMMSVMHITIVALMALLFWGLFFTVLSGCWGWLWSVGFVGFGLAAWLLRVSGRSRRSAKAKDATND